MVAYTALELCALCRNDVRPPRQARKVIFSLHLWLPAHQRVYSQRVIRARSISCSLAPISRLFLGCVNACSVGNKSALFCRTITEGRFDVLVVVETWHDCSQSVVLRRIAPPGYQLIDAARPIPADVSADTADFQNHGGLAFVFRQSTVRVQKRLLDVTVTTFEYLCGYVLTKSSHFLLLGIYRPGSQAPTAAFFEELTSVFEQLATYRCSVVVCGDFNIHVDQSQDAHAERLSQLLQSFDCQQHVNQPTHTAGHTLDLVIARADSPVCDLRVGDFISDHALVSFKVEGAKKLPATVHPVQRRAWSRLSHDTFAVDLQSSVLCRDLDSLSDMSVDELVSLYDSTFTGLLDKHCPLVTVRHKAQPMTPWFDAECRATRRRVRAAERRYKRTFLEVDKRAYGTPFY